MGWVESRSNIARSDGTRTRREYRAIAGWVIERREEKAKFVFRPSGRVRSPHGRSMCFFVRLLNDWLAAARWLTDVCFLRSLQARRLCTSAPSWWTCATHRSPTHHQKIFHVTWWRATRAPSTTTTTRTKWTEPTIRHPPRTKTTSRKTRVTAGRRSANRPKPRITSLTWTFKLPAARPINHPRAIGIGGLIGTFFFRSCLIKSMRINGGCFTQQILRAAAVERATVQPNKTSDRFGPGMRPQLEINAAPFDNLVLRKLNALVCKESFCANLQ